ncbi:MAG TPA: hypothetical protein VFA33_28220 [Bryobacteraceae bacterium]|nr:hypothetical protein [Bryobacteraceae bacterium]
MPAVLLASRAAGANERIRVGAIGTGGQGRFNLKVFLKNPEVEVPVVCDVNQLNARKANQELLAG